MLAETIIDIITLRGDSDYIVLVVVYMVIHMHLIQPPHPIPTHPIIENHEMMLPMNEAVLMLRTPAAVCILNTGQAPLSLQQRNI